MSGTHYIQLLRKSALDAGWPENDLKFLASNKSLLRDVRAKYRERLRVLLTLDTSTPFVPARFLGREWKRLEHDERADKLPQVDFSQAIFEHCLKDGEITLKGEEIFLRLKAREHEFIRLGGQQFYALWKNYQRNKNASVLERIHMVHGITHIAFMGLVLMDPNCHRCVLYLSRNSDCWSWDSYRLGYFWNRVPVLVSVGLPASVLKL